ncbi:MAG: RsmD family RNA methyltransferase [Alphaproteobacteria bacterium]|nr:MAG: RsmD family RNA methyltransferase [Alphaproteobacteria bacterium]
MRIISGFRKGKKLERPLNIRPTRDFVKEAIFNIIGSCQDLVVADVCAGSGALGIEALSRGAKKAVFIEKDKKNCAIIQKNLRGFGNVILSERRELRHSERSEESSHSNTQEDPSPSTQDDRELPQDVGAVIINQPFESVANLTADLVFFDPPYENEALYQKIFEMNWKVKTLVIESDKPIKPPFNSSYKFKEQRKYGSTYISLIVF